MGVGRPLRITRDGVMHVPGRRRVYSLGPRQSDRLWRVGQGVWVPWFMYIYSQDVVDVSCREGVGKSVSLNCNTCRSEQVEVSILNFVHQRLLVVRPDGLLEDISKFGKGLARRLDPGLVQPRGAFSRSLAR
jgi:hypothetical protein